MRLFDHIKTRLRQGEALPPELAWEEVQEGIVQRMDEIQGSPNRPKLLRTPTIVVLLVAAAGLAWLLLFQPDSSTQRAGNTDFEQSWSTATDAQAAVAPDRRTTPLSSPAHSHLPAHESDLQQALSHPGSAVHHPEPGLAGRDGKLDADGPGSEAVRAPDHSGPSHELADLRDARLTRAAEVRTPTPDAGVADTPRADQKTSTAIPILSALPSTAAPETWRFSPLTALDRMTPTLTPPARTLPLIYQAPIPAQTDIRIPEHRRWQLDLGGGILAWSADFPVTAEADQKEVAVPGMAASLRLSYRVTPRIALTTGADWQELFSRLDLQHVHRFSEPRQNVLLEIVTNPYSGQTEQIYGDTSVLVTETRTLRHYNRFRSWSLPVLLSVHTQGQRVRAQLGGGALFSIRTTAKGRALVEGEVVSYSKPYLKAGQMALVGEGSISYRLFGAFELGARIGLQYPIGHWSTVPTQSFRPLLFGSQLFVGYRF